MIGGRNFIELYWNFIVNKNDLTINDNISKGVTENVFNMIKEINESKKLTKIWM